MNASRFGTSSTNQTFRAASQRAPRRRARSFSMKGAWRFTRIAASDHTMLASRRTRFWCPRGQGSRISRSRAARTLHSGRQAAMLPLDRTAGRHHVDGLSPNRRQGRRCTLISSPSCGNPVRQDVYSLLSPASPSVRCYPGYVPRAHSPTPPMPNRAHRRSCAVRPYCVVFKRSY